MGTKGTQKNGPIAALLGPLRPGEGRMAAWAALAFFFVLASYYVLRPLRDSFGAEEPQFLRWLFTGTFALTLVIQPLFGWIVARFGRARVIPYVYRFLFANALIFGILLGHTDGDVLRWVRISFFWWISVYVLLAVSVFWGLMADLCGAERARRLFGLIAIGGTLGTLVGSGMIRELIVARDATGFGLRESWVPFVAGGFLECAVFAIRRLERVELPPEEGEVRADPGEPVGGGVLDGFKRVAASPYLIMICGYVALYVAGSSLLYQVSSYVTSDAFDTSGARTQFFATVDWTVGLVSLAFQLFVTGRVMRRVGSGLHS